MSSRALDSALPGSPRPRLVRLVRRHLASFGIRPMRDQWLMAWRWARNIAMSYSKPMWPVGSEIASQYMVLMLAEMRRCSSLKLPYRASRADVVPDEIRALVHGGRLALPEPEEPGL